MALVPSGFAALAGKEGGIPASDICCITFRQELYSFIVNPFIPKGHPLKWADIPQLCDPSLL